ncbi:MAG: peroxiredoxin [Rhodobacteraceae bacterium]|nr:peroxiredoxin [Paracoccaceae bacterium]
MTISVGDSLPDVTLREMTDDGPKEVPLSSKTKGRKVVLVGMPGAFTPTCDAAHVPSFIRTKGQFDAKGVDEIIVIANNDVHVMRLWGEKTGGTAAGLTFLADSDGEYGRAVGLTFSAPPVGMFDRLVRHALVIEDGVVKALQVEEARGVCDMTGGETLVEMI